MLSACCPVGICDFVGRERSEARCRLHLVNYPPQTTYIYGCGTQAYYNQKCTLYTHIYMHGYIRRPTALHVFMHTCIHTYICIHITHIQKFIHIYIHIYVGRGGALVESKSFDWRVVVGSNPALSAT